MSRVAGSTTLRARMRLGARISWTEVNYELSADNSCEPTASDYPKTFDLLLISRKGSSR